MKTWVESFHEEGLYSIEKAINKYAEDKDAEIVSTSFAVREFTYGPDTFYALVVFRKAE